MAERLTAEREAEIREFNRRANGTMEWDLLAELDAVRAERDAALADTKEYRNLWLESHGVLCDTRAELEDWQGKGSKLSVALGLERDKLKAQRDALLEAAKATVRSMEESCVDEAAEDDPLADLYAQLQAAIAKAEASNA